MQLALLKVAFRWDTSQTGMLLYEGVGELEVASIIDTYTRSGAARIQTVAPERRVIHSRHGLHLVPRWSFADAPALDRVLVPGRGTDNVDESAVEAWAQQRYAVRAEYVHREAPVGTYSYDATLRDMARHEPIGVVAEAARELEYPVEHLRIAGRAWPWFLLRPIALSLAGLGLAIALRRWRTMHGVRTAGVPTQPTLQHVS